MSVVVYELNEVPRKLFDFYADAFPSSAFAQLRQRSNLFESLTVDVGHLSPWITWPTMHRGVSNVDHGAKFTALYDAYTVSKIGRTSTAHVGFSLRKR